MSDPAAEKPIRVAVIGGGITGLAAALKLRDLDPRLDVTVLEAAGRLGGLLDTVRQDGFLVEQSADNFLSEPADAVEFCRRIGLAEELLTPDTRRAGASVVRDGKLYPIPEGFQLLAPRRVWPILASQLLSLRGRLRLACERFVAARREGPEESVAGFATRRLGREAYERLVEPLVAGIYGADPARLSVAAALPRFVELEQRFGSLTRGIRRQRGRGDSGADRGARYGLFVGPRQGMSSIVEAAAARLPQDAVRLGAAVTRVSHSERGWVVALADAGETMHCDAVVVASGARAAARILSGLDPGLAAAVNEIPHSDSAVVSLGFREDARERPLAGFGFVVPQVERRAILAASYASAKYPGRAPRGHVLIRVFLGDGREDQLELSDDALVRTACDELAALVGLSGEPVLALVMRYRGAMPQYELGHLQRVAHIESLLAAWPGLALAGNAYRGVGIPHCVRSGEEAAAQVFRAIRTGQTAAKHRPPG